MNLKSFSFEHNSSPTFQDIQTYGIAYIKLDERQRILCHPG